MSTFVLQIQDLEASGKDWNFEISAGWLVSALTDSDLHAHADAEPGTLHVHAQRSGADVLVQSQIEARVFVECSRCLTEVPLDLDLAITTLFSPGHPQAQHLPEEEQTEDDLDREHFTGSQIVLDDLVREHMILEAPMQPLCSETCPGIDIPKHIKPPEGVFGKGVRKDSPFAALTKLKSKLSNNEE